jgi:tetratricopeptide (TPR) repeat protein
MDAVTYPDKKVMAFIQESFIPLLIPFDAKPQSFDKREHHRTVGFLEPDAFVANSLLGIGKYHFDNDRYPEALTFFEKIISGQPQSDCVAEAIFLRGVSRYKNSGDLEPLKEVFETLNSQFPDSEWAKRAYPYRTGCFKDHIKN